MNRNTMLALGALILVVLGALGLFAGYKGYKKYKAKQNQEFRFEGKLALQQAGVDPATVKAAFLSDAALDRLVTDHDLVNVWGLADADAAKEKIKTKFNVTISGLEAKVTYQDKDKELAEKLIHAIMSPKQPAPSSAQ